jgi:hypothetical protein
MTHYHLTDRTARAQRSEAISGRAILGVLAVVALIVGVAAFFGPAEAPQQDRAGAAAPAYIEDWRGNSARLQPAQ